MNARSSGRRAALPPMDYRRTSREVAPQDCRVRFVPENPAEQPREYDFTDWPISPALREAFAAAFAARTRPGGGVRTLASANHNWTHLRSFSDYLTGLVSPPLAPEQLTRAHLKGWFLPRGHSTAGGELGVLTKTLRRIEGISVEFRTALSERLPARVRRPPTASYSRGENQRILNAARRDVRRAAERIRGNRDLLRRWRAGELDAEDETICRTGELLDYVDRNTDVPRDRENVPTYRSSQLGTVAQHLSALHLSTTDATTFVVLLVGLTGQNRSTILAAPAAHHRPDGYAGGVPSAIIELDKPRRGSRRHMDVPLTSLPTWAGHADSAGAEGESPGGRVDLQSPFGVYMLLHELAAPARQILGSDRLLVWWTGKAGREGRSPGLRTGLNTSLVRAWAWERGLSTDPGQDRKTEKLTLTLARLRLTYNELQQRPVAHTDRTLANEYLARNRGNLAEYQQVVAGALAEQVTKAATRGRLLTLSEQDITEARVHPARVAARHGMDALTLQRMLAGELDTVLGACVDDTNGPHTSAGQPCRASFMLCLSCPCARATPAHLPVQVLVHDQLEQRRTELTPLRWAQRLALPHAQLADLLNRAGPAMVTDAREALTSADRRLVERFLNRELDLP